MLRPRPIFRLQYLTNQASFLSAGSDRRTKSLIIYPIVEVQISNAAQIAALDPRGVRTRLFDRKNPDAPQPGDILMVTFKTGEPFAGICLSIKRRGVDTAILLRNKLMLTGVEVWAKIYSPNVRSIEIVKRAAKRARRARLYYKRLPKHDLSGSGLESEVENYLRTRRLIRSGALTGGTQQTGAAGGVERK